MALILNGTLGLSDVDGTAATPAIRGTDTNTGIFFPAADTIAFAEGGVEAMRLDSAGNMGIGTSSPLTKLDVVGVIQSKGSALSVTDVNGTNPFFINRENTVTGNLQFRYSSTSLMELTQSGNLGLGVTPSAWNSTYNGFDIGGSSISGRTSTNNQLDLSSNGFRNAAGNWVYKFNGPAVRFTVDGSASGYQWYTAPSGTAGNAISFTQAMTLTAGGDLAIGTTASNGRLTVVGPGQTIVRVKGGAGTNQGSALYFENAGNTSTLAAFGDTASIFGGVSPDTSVTIFTGGGVPLVFAAGATERARIDSSGNLLVGTTSAALTSGIGLKAVASTVAPSYATVGSSTSNGDGTYTLYSTGAGAYRFYVGMGGTIFATSTSISAISDASLKENVRDLETGLTEVMALRPRRFDWINGDAQDVAGFVAQEVEQVLPELVADYVYNKDEDGNDIIKKSLKMGDILPTLVKAIQEQQAMIDTLKADVANLKGTA